MPGDAGEVEADRFAESFSSAQDAALRPGQWPSVAGVGSAAADRAGGTGAALSSSPGAALQREVTNDAEDEPAEGEAAADPAVGSGPRVRVVNETPVLSDPADPASEIATLPVDAILETLDPVADQDPSFTHVRYRGQEGYVESGDIVEDLVTTSVPLLAADVEMGRQLAARYPDGLNVGFYMIGTGRDYGEILEGAQAWAAAWHSVGVKDGRLEFDTSTGITGPDNLIHHTNAIVSAARAMAPAPAEGGDGVSPPWAQIRNLAISAHGTRGGLSGIVGAAEGDPVDQTKLRRFVDGIRGYLSTDVRVHLFACDAAAAPGENATWGSFGDPAAREPQGEGSFAQSMQESLVNAGNSGAATSGHTQTGHTTRNWTVRFYGGEVAQSQVDPEAATRAGVDALTYIFGEDFVQSEMARLYPTVAADERERREEDLRGKLRRVYKAIGQPTDRQSDVQMARDIMSNPSGARDAMRTFWQSLVPDAAALRALNTGVYWRAEHNDDPETTRNETIAVENDPARREFIERWKSWLEAHPIPRVGGEASRETASSPDDGSLQRRRSAIVPLP